MRLRSLFLIAFCLLPSPPLHAAANLNWVLNGDFKSAAGWTNNPTLVTGREGGKALLIENQESKWTDHKQSIALPKPAPPAVEVSFGMKTENVVPGDKDWELARMNVTFFDEKGVQVGGWPTDPGRATGTTPWKAYNYSYQVPQGAATITLSLELGNAKGKAWFDRVSLAVYDFDLQPLSAGAKATNPSAKKPRKPQGDNWLLNPGFEDPVSSDWSSGRKDAPGRESLHCVTFTNAKEEWNTGLQMVNFNGAKPAKLALSGWIKTQDVKMGAESYMTARFSLDFRDASNTQVGGWQTGVGNATGTTPWTRYEYTYPVPAGAEQAEVGIGLAHCVGQAWFDDMEVTLLDASGKRLAAQVVAEQVTDKSDWVAFKAADSPDAASLDLSFLNEAPAGKRGFVKVVDGRYAFEDGTPVRFWGTDLVANNAFLTHEQSDALATRFAKLGINLVRFHHMDAPWSNPNIFDPSAKDTQTFSADSLDKLDYLLAALKKKGIYVYPDLLVHRKFREGDGVADYNHLPEGAKGVAHFSKRVIELNKKYAKDLLTHKNPYTGLSLAEDPFFVATELVNESSIFSGFGQEDFPPAFEAELQKLYEAWGGKGQITRFAYDWGTQKLKAVRNPENAVQSFRFLSETSEATNADFQKYLRSLGVKSLFTMSNQGLPILADIRADAKLDHIDTHAYWDHPQVWNVQGGWENIDKAPFTNKSQLKNPFRESLMYALSQGTVLGKPTIVTEWNDCVPNEYRLEGPALMAVYGCLQDWGGLLQFDASPDLPGSKRLGSFSITTRPANEVFYQAGAMIFRSGLVKPADVTLVEPLSDKVVDSPESASPWIAEHPWLPYAVQVRKEFTGKVEKALPSLDKVAALHHEKAKTIRSSHGQVLLDYGTGLLKVDAPQAQGFVGFVGEGAKLASSMLTFASDPRNPWAGVLAVSLDNKPLNHSARIVVFTAAKEENTDQIFNATRTALKDPGRLPVLEQWVKGTLTLKVAGAGKFEAYALNESGKRGKALPLTIKDGALTMSLSPKNGSGYYEIVRK